jgi:hypothetical protein
MLPQSDEQSLIFICAAAQRAPALRLSTNSLAAHVWCGVVVWCVAGPYLDLVRDAKNMTNLPIAIYHVSVQRVPPRPAPPPPLPSLSPAVCVVGAAFDGVVLCGGMLCCVVLRCV